VTGTPGRGRGSRGRGSSSLRGRPPLSGKQPGKVGRPPKRKNRKDKGKPKYVEALFSPMCSFILNFCSIKISFLSDGLLTCYGQHEKEKSLLLNKQI